MRWEGSSGKHAMHTRHRSQLRAPARTVRVLTGSWPDKVAHEAAAEMAGFAASQRAINSKLPSSPRLAEINPQTGKRLHKNQLPGFIAPDRGPRPKRRKTRQGSLVAAAFFWMGRSSPDITRWIDQEVRFRPPKRVSHWGPGWKLLGYSQVGARAMARAQALLGE